MKSVPLIILVAFGFLGEALRISNGHYGTRPLLFVTLSLVTLVALALKEPKQKLNENLVVWVGGIWVLHMLFGHMNDAPGVFFSKAKASQVGFQTLVAIPTAAFLFFVLYSQRLWRLGFWCVLLSFAALGAMAIINTPSPHIDVYYFQKVASERLASGINPYGMSIPNIYKSNEFYGPGLSNNDFVFIGYPYLPTSLLMALPGLFLGDVRFTHLILTALTGLFLFKISNTRFGAVIATAFLFQPRVFFFLEQSWVDNIGIAFAALFALTLTVPRFEKYSSAALGLFIAAKQTNPLAFPFLIGLSQRKMQTLVTVGMITLATVLPFLIADVEGFINDVILCQLKQPFRDDALSFLAYAKAKGLVIHSAGVAFVAALLPAALLRKNENRQIPYRAFLLCALSFLLFYVFNKQAFCNYYVFVMGLLAISASLSTRAVEHFDKVSTIT